MLENIKFKYDYFCTLDGSYYYIDKDYQTFVIKSSSGKTIFTYPLSDRILSKPLKLKTNGTYFFSLHLDYGKYLLYKWVLKKTVLQLVNVYDYSPLGLLSTKERVFSKFFNNALLFGGWAQTTTEGAVLGINNNEFVVYSYGTASSWRGGELEKTFFPVDNFIFKTKFFVSIDNTSNKLVYTLGESVIEVTIEYYNTIIKVNGSLVFNSFAGVLQDAYNSLRIECYDGIVYFWVNGSFIVSQSMDGQNVGKVIVGIYKYLSSARNEIRVNYLTLTKYITQHKIDTEVFDVDSYKTTLVSGITAGTDYLDLEGQVSYIEAGTELAIGNTFSSNFEVVTVTGIISNGRFGLSFPTQYNHQEDDKVYYSRYFYIFNNNQRLSTGGSIYRLDYYTGYLDTYFDNVSFYGVSAATFYEWYGAYLLGYIQGTNFVQLDTLNNMSIYNVMNIDNVESDNSTIIDIYDVAVSVGSLIRLQRKATYYGTTYSWSTYNYQLSPIRSFVDSVTIDAYPMILNADGVSQSKISAVVKDQYAEPAQVIRVDYTEDDPDGYMTLLDRYTGAHGTSYNYYRSGLIPRGVYIQVEAIQEV